jgi:hypothetical protein
MAAVWERLTSFYRNLMSGAMPRFSERLFEADPNPSNKASEIIRDRMYFGLTIDQINLREGRTLWSEYDPLLYVSIDFLHGGERVTIPRLVGLSTVQKSLPSGTNQIPHGFSVSDTRVAGPHPYRGEQVGITVILYKVRTTDYAKRIVGIARGLSEAIGLPANMETLAKIGDSVVDTIEALTGTGESEAILGQRVELSASPINGFRPKRVALIGGDDKIPSDLSVTDNRLRRTTNEAYTSGDFVLYTLWGADKTESESRLGFYPLVQKMYESAAAGDDTSWERAKSTLITIYQQMLTSPDLTSGDADRLFDQYKSDILAKRVRPRSVMVMGDKSGSADSAGVYRRDYQQRQMNDRMKQMLDLADPRSG